MNRRMKLVLLILYCLGVVATKATAQVDPMTVYQVGSFIAGAVEEMRKWQNAQSWGKFKSRHFLPPVKIGNLTNIPVSLTIESDNCDPSTETIEPGGTWDARCEDGDPWYNYFLNGEASSADAGDVLTIEIGADNKPHVYDHTAEVKAQAGK